MPIKNKKAIDKKMRILETSDDIFLDSIKDVQRKIRKRIIRFLRTLSTNGNRLDPGRANQATLLSIGRELRGIITTSTFASQTKRFLRDFDRIESLNREILDDLDDVDMSILDFGVEKELAVEQIVDGLLNQQMLRIGLVKPIRKIIFRHVTTGIKIEDAENELRNFISGNDKAGFVEKYVRNIAQSSLNRYDGIINQKTAEEFELDAFSIVGSLIKTSMPVCRDMVRAQNRFSKLSANDKYRIEDIPKIIAIIKTQPGFIEGTNESNYFINGNHWGCRHSFIPSRLLDRDIRAFEKLGLN